MSPLLCAIYKSRKKSELYLYLAKKDDFSKIPAALLEQFGPPELVTVMALTENRQFARIDLKKLLLALDTQGFYLQLPPSDPEQRVAW